MIMPMHNEFKRLLYNAEVMPPKCATLKCFDYDVNVYLVGFESGQKRMVLCSDCLDRILTLGSIIEDKVIPWSYAY